MSKDTKLLNGENRKELESLFMVLNGVTKELEYTLLSNMTESDKFSKFSTLLDELEIYSDKVRKLLIEKQ